MASQTVLVTGAAGFIGQRLVKQLRAAGDCDVIGWTRLDGDLRDAEAVRSVLSRRRPDLIFHLAARLYGPEVESWSAVAGEQSMLGNLVYAMPSHCRLIYTGSMAEYGKSGVLHESEQCAPGTGYGCAKLSGTSLALALKAMLGVDVRVARPFGVYGPGEAPSRLLPRLIGMLKEGQKVPMSDGEQVRDFVHVDDLCTALIALGAAPAKEVPDIVNVGTGIGLSVKELSKLVAQILNADPQLLEFGAIPRRATDQDCLIADTERLRALTPPPPQRWLDPPSARRIVEDFLAEHNAAECH